MWYYEDTHTLPSHPHIHPTHQPRRGKGERGEGERALTVMECPPAPPFKISSKLESLALQPLKYQSQHTQIERERNGDLLHTFDILAERYI